MQKINELNGDYTKRDKIIFSEYEPDKYLCGVRHFECGRETIQQLLNEQFIDPLECQNNSPYTKEFMESTEDFSDVTFLCYAVSPKRDDYRVVIEGINVKVNDHDFDLVAKAVELFHFADEFNFEHYGSSYFIHAWWD